MLHVRELIIVTSKLYLVMKDYLIFITSISIGIVIVWALAAMVVVFTSNSIIRKAMAGNASTVTLGNPIYIAHDKVTNVTELNVNSSKALIGSFSGNATIKGIPVREVGRSLVIFRPDGSADVKGQAIIIAKDDSSKANTIFYGISYAARNGTTVSNGAAFLHTTTSSITNGKLDPVNNLVIIFKSQADKFRNLKITGWEWK